MSPTSKLLVPALAFAFTGVAFGQADDCAAATVLTSGSTTIMFDTNMCTDTGTAATTSPEQQCFSLSNDVWFEWTAVNTGMATFDTCNNATFDTEIGIWDGNDCVTMVGLGCNDDFSGCSGLTSMITVPVLAGNVYKIQLGYWSTSGSTWGAGLLSVDNGGPATIGTNYCGPAALNSTGMSGVMSASGSDVIANADLTVTGGNLPSSQFAYFIASRTQGFVANPGGSAGNLCVIGQIARFNRAGEVGAIAGGTFSLLVPLSDIPDPMGSVAALAGDTWNFQCWHRDIAGGVPTSNFTDGLEILFQ